MLEIETEPVTFSEYLNLLPADLLFERFVKPSAMPRKIISASMVKEITAHFSTEKNLFAAFENLSPEAQITCGLAYLFGSQGAPMGEVFQHKRVEADRGAAGGVKTHGAPDATGEGVGLGFDDELLRSFLVYAAKDDFGTMQYIGFKEFEPVLRKILSQTIVQRTQVQPQKEAPAFAPYVCISDVAVAISLASQGKLVKTKAGGLSKAAGVLLHNLLHGAHGRLDTGRKDFNAVSCALRYASRQGLLPDGAPGASHKRILTWLSRPLELTYAEIVDFAFSTLPLWSRDLIDAILAKPEKPWLSAVAFGAQWKEDICAQVKILAYCGLIDFYRSGGDCVFTRSASVDAAYWKQADRRIIIQPDFSAMLPQETSPERLYWFSKVGSFESLDTVYRGTIAKDIVCNSLYQGIAGSELLSMLAQWGAPSNVVETVREWIREFDRVSLWNGSMIVSAAEKITRQLCSYEPLKSCIEPIRADCVFRVIPGKETEVERMLAAMGFDSRPSFAPIPDATIADDALGDLEAPSAAVRLTPVVDFCKKEPSVPVVVKQGKYSPHLKALELTELMHVIDYALLMGNRVRVDYAGSLRLRKGEYLIRPLAYKKGTEPQLEAETGNQGLKKLFLLSRILKIGVEPDNDRHK